MSKIYLDENKQGITVEEYLLNKEVFCIKTVADTDFGSIISAYSTILITKVETSEVREDTLFLGLSFKDFSGEEKEVKFYIDGGTYSLASFVKTTFYPVHRTFLRLTENAGCL